MLDTLNLDSIRNDFEYNPYTGILKRKVRMGKCIKGSVVGTHDGKGYLRFYYKGLNLKVHRFVWYIYTGELPDKYIDHINGVKDDNSFSNLRLATPSENSCNMKITSRNTSGIKGVSWHKLTGMWRVSLCHKGVNRHLGNFETIEKAAECIRVFRSKQHKDFSNDG